MTEAEKLLHLANFRLLSIDMLLAILDYKDADQLQASATESGMSMRLQRRINEYFGPDYNCIEFEADRKK